MTIRENKCPPHYWIVESNNVGKCRCCGELRDFGELLRRAGYGVGLKSKRSGTKGKRGRKKKEPATIAEMSASAKERWQDSEYRAKQRVAHASLSGRHHKKEELL